MPIRHPLFLAAAATAVLATPAFASDEQFVPAISAENVPLGDSSYGPDWMADSEGVWTGEGVEFADVAPPTMVPYSGIYPMAGHPGPHHPHAESVGLPPQPGAQRFAYGEAERSEWLRECRMRYGVDADGGLGGALIGGAIGGFAGNRIAGEGNRALGTVAGAAVGAIAGAAIDKSDGAGRRADVCEDYLARYEASQGAATYGHGYAYGQNVMWVPMIVGWNCKPKTQVIEEEWIEERPAIRALPKPKPTKYAPVKPAKGKAVPIKQAKPAKGS